MTIANHPISFDGIKGVLLDIEGTTSSISFVYDVMFPFARKHFAGYLSDHWESESVVAAIEMLATDVGVESVSELFAGATADDAKQKIVVDHLLRLMDNDVKATGLKKLQGLVWQSGFQTGEMTAHVYDDVFPAITSWKSAKIDVRIYSSGSVHAQKLFFAHSVAGDMLPLFSGHYDTTTGGKMDSDSYREIAKAFEMPPSKILFISDVAAELDAAADAGMQTCLSIRPGNKPVENADSYSAVTSFSQIVLK